MVIERKRKTTINSNLRHIKIYLDTNVWCRPFDEQTQQRIIDEGEAFLKILDKVHAERKYTIIGSLILDDEVKQIKGRRKREAVKTIMALFISEKVRSFSKSTVRDLKTAGLKDKDALHLAFAVQDHAKYFITTDDYIPKRKKDIEKKYKIKVINPIEFIEENGNEI
jgi:predicted nucleic acid-binding protein